MVLCSEFLLRFYSFVNSGRNMERISTPMIACLFKSNILGLADGMITLHLVSTSEGLGSMASTTHKSLSSDLTYTKHCLLLLPHSPCDREREGAGMRQDAYRLLNG